jgi:hypothetical protein
LQAIPERAASHREPNGETDHREQKHYCGDLKSGYFKTMNV